MAIYHDEHYGASDIEDMESTITKLEETIAQLERTAGNLRVIDKDEMRSVLAEGFHTAFRKGVDTSAAWKVWKAIDTLPNHEYGTAIEWLVEALDSMGYRFVNQRSTT